MNTGGVQRSRAPWRDAHEFLHRERDRGGRDQDRLAEPVARVQRLDDDAADQHAPSGRDRRRQHEREREPRDRIADAERDRRRDAADRPVGAEHGDLAERQIDPPDQPVDQRIGGREQRVDGGERDRVDQLLQRVGGSGGEFRKPCRERWRAALPLGFGQPEALEVEEPRVAERARRRSRPPPDRAGRARMWSRRSRR